MRIPLDWVREYVDSKLDASQTADALTMMGLEVEEVEEQGASGSPVLNIKVMSNRGDCLSMIGVARELAADENLPLKLPDFKMTAEGPEAETLAYVEIADPDLCYRYAATVIQDINVGQSPQWMADRLSAAGMRPINNIVDVTNYVMLETGQPLHAFDYDLLQEHTIVVRRACSGEKLTTLDGVERELKAGMLAICDKTRPVAVAGVMGGADTEVTQNTRNVLIESACFNGFSIRQTARTLGLPTEASYRFERGVDLGGTAFAAIRAAEMIRELAGGTICKGVVDAVAKAPETRSLTLRPTRVSTILGVELTAEACAEYLKRLSLHALAQDGIVKVTVPSYRGDLTSEVDLIEEIGRVYGFNNLPTTLIDSPSLQGKDSARGAFEDDVRALMRSMGLQEVMTHSITAKDTPRAKGAEPVLLRNALSEDVAEMRTSLLPGLVQVLGLNHGRGIRDLSVFETGKVFQEHGNRQEGRSTAGCLMGSRWEGMWIFPDKRVTPDGFSRALTADFYQAKGIAESLIAHCGLPGVEFKPGRAPLWRPGYAADIMSGGKLIGQVGEISEQLRDLHSLKIPIFGFELDMDALHDLAGDDGRWLPPSRFPAVRRDIAIVLDEKVEYARVVEHIRRAAAHSSGDILEEAVLFDFYRGAQLEAGKKSLAFSLTFRSKERTLTDESVTEVMAAVRSELARELNAAFRDS